MSDIHGDLFRFRDILESRGLVDPDGDWIGGCSWLVVCGDLGDRGCDSLSVLRYLRYLEETAPLSGGRVVVLMGNHDALWIAARFDLAAGKTVDESRALRNVVKNGGRLDDIAALTEDEVEWLSSLPCMVKIGGDLLLHSDGAGPYLGFGGTPDEANGAVRQAVRSPDGAYGVFAALTRAREWSEFEVDSLLEAFGASRVIHGHTRFLGNAPAVYYDGKAINLDACMSDAYTWAPDRGCILDVSPAPAAG